MTRDATPTAPLRHLRVIDLTVARAGPNCVRYLADWGADVVRIDVPAGRDGFGAGSTGSDYLNLHRNKRALTLDLKHETGREIFLRLVRDADIVVENFRPAVKHQLGIDYESLRELNPRLVYGSISGFGQDGPYGDRPGVDQIAQGLGGLMSVTGLPGQGPVRVGIAISDMAAGLYLALGILTAVIERQASGVGQWVHTSLLESQIAMLDFQATRWLIDGVVPPQEGNHHPTGTPMGVYPTADGHINIAAPADHMFQRLCTALGAAELLERDDYKSAGRRTRNREALTRDLSRFTTLRKSEEWVQILNDAGVPCGPIHSIDAVFADPQVQHLGIATPVEHARLGTLRVVAQPVHLTRTPSEMRRAAPDRGEHSDEILRELGYDEERIQALRAQRVV